MASQNSRSTPCIRCGGSGVLRTSEAGYRTCLDCIGQGALPQFSSVIEDCRERGRPGRPAVLGAAFSASSSGAR